MTAVDVTTPPVIDGRPQDELWSRAMQLSVLYRPTYRLVFDLGVQVTDIDLPQPDGSFVSSLASVRSGYSFSTNMFLDALVQYRTDVKQFSANIRFNLIHRPLSDLSSSTTSSS